MLECNEEEKKSTEYRVEGIGVRCGLLPPFLVAGLGVGGQGAGYRVEGLGVRCILAPWMLPIG